MDLSVLKAAEILRGGGVVAFPTETVYGLGASISFPKAVAAIFELKNRPHFDPLIVHISSMVQLTAIATIPPVVDKKIKLLILNFWPGPLTLLLPKKDLVPDLVTSGLSSVGVRMPLHPVALDLIERVGSPLCAPSANKFGRLSPTTAEHVRAQFGIDVEVLDGGPCDVGVESTIIEFRGEKPFILRPGGVTKEKLEEILKEPVEVAQDHDEVIKAPGQLKSHYAPTTPLKILWDRTRDLSASKNKALLSLLPSDRAQEYRVKEVLSATGDLKEAAANLFSALHRLDHLNLDVIEVEPMPMLGLGLAIMNRLEKAASK